MSNHISIHNLTFQYGSHSEPLFQNLNLHFAKGWTGIVGKNGSGKSTLAKIICGELLPEKGNVLGNGFVCSLTQGTEVPCEVLADFLEDGTKESGYWKSLLQVEIESIDSYLSLSFGEKRRLLLAMVLSKQSDVLVLDEPTNHLDHFSAKLIRETILNYKGIGILISHDRDLLDGVINSCVFLEKNFVTQRNGNYSLGKKEMEREKEEKIRDWEIAKQERKKLDSELKRRREVANNSHHRRSKKGLHIHDHDGRGKINLARVTGKDGQAGKLKNQIETRTERSTQREIDLRKTLPEKETIGIKWLSTPSRKNNLCLLQDGILDLDFLQLFLPSQLEIQVTSRIAITGNNGAGKSTLLKYLVLHLQKNGTKTFYLPQEFSNEELSQLYEQFQNLSEPKKAKVLSSFHHLGSDPIRFAESKQLSPGEGKKLYLCLHLEESFEVMLLDEPTNHLDLKSLEALEFSFMAYPSALLMASHDRRFVESVATKEWVLENFRLTQKHLDRI